jgi:hypothetical protein
MKRKDRQKLVSELASAKESVIETADVVMEEANDSDSVSRILEDILPPSDIDAILAALGSEELERSVQSLLEKNRQALQRLNELQILRLTESTAPSFPEEGSEEWDTGTGTFAYSRNSDY